MLKLLINIVIITLVSLIGANSFGNTVNRAGNDVYLLKAFIGDKVIHENMVGFSTNRIEIDLDKCIQIDYLSAYEQLVLDCSAQVQELAKQHGSDKLTPLLRPFIVNGHKSNGTVYTQTLNCSVIEVETAIKNSALNAVSFDGIGFFVNGRLTFIKKDSLHQISQVTLKEKSTPATIHRFIDISLCWRGSMSSSMNQDYELKPYASFFDAKTDTTYNNWENYTGNHIINFRGSKVIDRGNELTN
jgi:hypothetical protein